jgi:hypothetical protein
MQPTQLTRFLDPAAESRALLTRCISVLGLDPEAFTGVPRMTKDEVERVGRRTPARSRSRRNAFRHRRRRQRRV